MSTPPQFCLPDPVSLWPWPRTLNQHYQEAKLESDNWLRDFEALDAKSQRSFNFCDFRKHIPRLPLVQVLKSIYSASQQPWISVAR